MSGLSRACPGKDAITFTFSLFAFSYYIFLPFPIAISPEPLYNVLI